MIEVFSFILTCILVALSTMLALAILFTLAFILMGISALCTLPLRRRL